MSAYVHTLVDDKCRGDGICVEICPKDVLEMRDGKARAIEAAAKECLGCGQCVAVCPNEALGLEGLERATLAIAPSGKASFDELCALFATRRSVRVFKDQSVERDLLDRVLEAAALAPPGLPPHTTEVLVLDQRDDIRRLARACVDGYDKLLRVFRNPIGRLVVRAKRGAELAHSIAHHVLGIVRWDNERFRARGVDRYLYDAPAVMLFYASRWATAYRENAMLTATYAMLAAHALGLGATMLSIVPPVLNSLDHDLRRTYGISDDHQVVVALILGHPKYKYRRIIARELASVRYLRQGGDPASGPDQDP